MFDRMHALAHGKADILGTDVVLEIDEGLGVGLRSGAFGSADHAACPVIGLLGRNCDFLAAAFAGGLRHQFAGGKRFLDRPLQVVGAVAGADRETVLA